MGNEQVLYRQHGHHAVVREPLPHLRIWTLGRFTVERNQQLVHPGAWRRRSATTAFKLLLINRRLSRDQLGAFLFPDADIPTTRKRLTDALHALRYALEPDLVHASASRYVVEHAQLLVLRLGEQDWVDFRAFEDTLRAATHAEDPLPLLKDAAELYAGDLFLEESSPWCEAFREDLRVRWHDGLLRLAEEQERHGQEVEAILTLQRLIGADPLHERAVRHVMRIYWRLGQPGQALRLYQRLVDTLREEVGAPPSLDTRTLAEAIRCM
ncbi:MAG TPA: bacterial transcriptional activator domain-containing protein [Chloroflexota bacterium]|jgi:DNA-binding SARP family transcriptional activator|nr:bacterial transcriptional activator domain-containing protein [Chloroflexota bacterium]